jgi:2-methylisoborneol synthase
VSVLSRVAAPTAHSDLAGVVAALFADPTRAAPADPLAPADAPDAPPPSPPVPALTGLGTAAARAFAGAATATPVLDRPPPPSSLPGPTGLGTAALRIGAPAVAEPEPAPGPEPAVEPEPAGPGGQVLFCPPAVRDDVALGEAVNDALVDWAAQVGIYPGQLDRLRAANFGRLIMLTHPATDDPDRLLAAGKCIVAEWATDDHFLDDESLGADPALIGARLAVTYAAIDPADLPARYAPQLDQALDGEPVAVAYRSAFEHLARYATATQQARLRHELAVMFMAYNQEATWRATGRVPPVWEYLTHRHENSFLPPMVLVDPVAGYELPADEFADRRVRRAFCLAGTASVVLNDLYSRAKETEADFDLPKLIALEDGCSPEEAIERTVEIHNELMHTFVAEASVLSQLGSPALRRFLMDIWAWLGGSREWHSTTARYQAAASK